MEFTKSKHGRKKKRQRQAYTATCSDDFDEIEALRMLKRVCPAACIFTKDDSDTDTASEDEDLPPQLTRFHEVEYKEMSKGEFDEKCRKFVSDFTTTTEQAERLEQRTRAQSNSPLWQRQRQGRITATVAHDVLTLKETTCKDNLLRKVMQYRTTDLSKLESVKFGRQNESKARDMYLEKMKDKHDSFSVSECGLFVDTSFPLFAATPDGVRTCTCHGQGLLEIKCSFKHRDSYVSEIDDSTFYLDSNSELKKSHRYFTQIQFQMYVCGKSFCDFVVFTNKGIMIKTIYYDSEFVNSLIGKCTKFAIDDLVSEILQHKLQL